MAAQWWFSYRPFSLLFQNSELGFHWFCFHTGDWSSTRVFPLYGCRQSWLGIVSHISLPLQWRFSLKIIGTGHFGIKKQMIKPIPFTVSHTKGRNEIHWYQQKQPSYFSSHSRINENQMQNFIVLPQKRKRWIKQRLITAILLIYCVTLKSQHWRTPHMEHVLVESNNSSFSKVSPVFLSHAKTAVPISLLLKGPWRWGRRQRAFPFSWLPLSPLRSSQEKQFTREVFGIISNRTKKKLSLHEHQSLSR